MGEMGNDESGEWEKWSVEPDGGVGAEDEWRGTPTPQQQSHTQQDVPAPQAHLQHKTARTHSRMAPQYQHRQQIYTTTVSSQYDDTPHLFILNQAGLTTQHNGMVAQWEGTPTPQQSAIVPRCNISIVLAV